MKRSARLETPGASENFRVKTTHPQRCKTLLKGAAAAFALGGGLALAAGDTASVAHGKRLFAGDAPMVGRIAGHELVLPSRANRCINCHAAGAALPSRAASASTPSFGPTLTANLLLGSHSRRGGPPSRYDEAAFCRLLRTGVDPAYVIVVRAMPRYELSAQDCRALWTHLTETER